MNRKISILLLMSALFSLISSCSIFAPNDKKLVRQTLMNWKTALEQKDIDGMMKTYSDNFTGQQGEDKVHVRDFLIGMKEQGLLENLKLNFEDTKITITEGTATAAPVRIVGDFGETNEFIITWTLKKDKDKVWRIVKSYME